MDKVVIKTIPKKKNYEKAKWFSEEALQIAEKRRKALVFFFLAYFTLYNWLQFHPPH